MSVLKNTIKLFAKMYKIAISFFIASALIVITQGHICSHKTGDDTVNCTAHSLYDIPANNFPGVISQLILNENHFEIINNNSFSTFPDLTFLSIQKSNVELVRQDAFRGLDKLEVLKLSKNKLTRIHVETFEYLLKLTMLDLGANPLKKSSSKAPLIVSNSITVLSLGNTNLTKVRNNTFSGLPRLKYLDLTNNKLTTLPSNFFDTLPRLIEVTLHGNPWRCDVMTEVMLIKRDIITDINKIDCVKTGDLLSIFSETSSQQTTEEAWSEITTPQPREEAIPKTQAVEESTTTVSAANAETTTNQHVIEDDSSTVNDREETNNIFLIIVLIIASIYLLTIILIIIFYLRYMRNNAMLL